MVAKRLGTPVKAVTFESTLNHMLNGDVEKTVIPMESSTYSEVEDSKDVTYLMKDMLHTDLRAGCCKHHRSLELHAWWHREMPAFAQEHRFNVTVTCYSLFGFAIIVMGVIVVQYNKTVTNYRKPPHIITTKTFKMQRYICM